MSEANTLFRIDHLQLQNFRCFGNCSLDLHPALTVLVAENAQGKTALLDALRLALQDFVMAVGRAKQSPGFDHEDIRQVRLHIGDNRALMEPQLPTKFSVRGEVDSEPVSWSRVLGSKGFHARTSTKDTKAIRGLALRFSNRPDVNENLTVDAPTVLPVISYYGTGRLYDEHRLTEGKRFVASITPVRTSAYLDCLSPSSSYKSFAVWYGQAVSQTGDPRFRATGFLARPANMLAAVRDAVRIVLAPTGWAVIDWVDKIIDEQDRLLAPGQLVVEHADKGRLPLSQLSDGVRNMVALVGDLAHRCVRLNPHLGEEAARKTPGIVMIDEVDMHLHPLWQQLVVGLLRTAFPNVQFVLSTHSPHVLTTVRKEHIRAITPGEGGNWNALMPQHSPLGQESGDALAFIMRADSRPKLAILDEVHSYEQMARAGRAETREAIAILEKLNQAGFEFTDAQKALFSLLAKKSQNATPDRHG